MKHKIHITIVLAVVTLTSCQLLQKEKLLTKMKSETELLQIASQHHTLSQQSQLVLVDSSHSDFTMMLWPKGKFTFSVAKGFEGEAEKMLLKGKHTRQKVLNLKQEMEQDSTAFKANYSKEKESSTLIKKNRLSVGYSWAWLLVFPFLYLCYRFLK